MPRVETLGERPRVGGNPWWETKVEIFGVMPRLLRFGYLGKWSPCAYESLSTKGEDFYPHTLLYDSNFTLT
jgi:hypothetical protein